MRVCVCACVRVCVCACVRCGAVRCGAVRCGAVRGKCRCTTAEGEKDTSVACLMASSSTATSRRRAFTSSARHANWGRPLAPLAVRWSLFLCIHISSHASLTTPVSIQLMRRAHADSNLYRTLCHLGRRYRDVDGWCWRWDEGGRQPSVPRHAGAMRRGRQGRESLLMREWKWRDWRCIGWIAHRRGREA